MDISKRKLPIGIQTFEKIREEGYIYVDKTGNLVTAYCYKNVTFREMGYLAMSFS